VLGVSCAWAVTPCAPMDFNGDCKSDVLWRNKRGQDYLWLMNGPTIASQAYLSTVDDPAWIIAGIGDFDGDGKADILWRNTLTGENYLWLMNGLTVAADGLVNFVEDPAWQIQGVADFDGDGRADILWRNTSTGENYMYLMNGWTIVAEGLVNIVEDQAWQVKGIGDFDGDGRADILWRNSVTGENYMYLMNGWTIVADGLVNIVDQNWQVKGIGDFDGDGKADILWRNSVTGENYMYLMNRWKIASEGRVNFSDPTSGWEIKAIGDFDGDGRADIWWRQMSTGQDYVYFMSGWTIAWEGAAAAKTDVNWMPRSALTIADSAGPDTVPPSTPAGLAASAVSTSKINLSWNAATDNVGVIRYRIYRDGAQLADVSQTSYSDTGLAAATPYRYTVAAYDAARNLSAQSNSASATTKATDTQAPSTPANLSAAVVSPAQINLSWSASTDNTGVAGYRVYRDGTLAANPRGTVVSIVGLSGGMTYSFAVSAYDAAGNVSALSPAFSVTTPVSDTTAPTVPTGLAASTLAGTSLTLSWSPSTDNVGVTGYRVYRDGVLLASPSATTVSVTGLVLGTTYAFTVAAFDAAGNASAPSPALSVSMPMPILDTVPPSAPSALSASGLTTTSLTLSWTASADNVGVAGYRMYRDGALVASPSATTVSITGLAAGTTYAFTVAAFDAAGNVSALSSALSVSTPAVDSASPSAPTGLAATGLTATSLTLSWSASTDNVGVTGYRVYRDAVLVASPAGTSVAITGLVPATLYSFTVAAVDAAGNASTPSAPLAVTTSAAPQILWSAGMEMGNLTEWSEKVNSGSADSWPVLAASEGIPPRGGKWVLKQAVTGTDGGSRMFRYPEIIDFSHSGTTFYWSWWDYYPSTITFGLSDSYMIWGIIGKDANGSYNPIWNLILGNTGNALKLVWSPNDMAPSAGPHAGESGKRYYNSSTSVPVGQWVYFEVMITPKADFSGALVLRCHFGGASLTGAVVERARFVGCEFGGADLPDGLALFDLSQVKTMYADAGQGDPLIALEQTGYGSGLTPIPAVRYVDDFTLSLGRVPYAP